MSVVDGTRFGRWVRGLVRQPAGLPETFADWPKSVADARSDRSNRENDWSPRDALIDMLRRLDRGEIKPIGLVIAYDEEPEAGRPVPNYVSAARSPLETVGLLEAAKHLTMRDL